MTEKQYKELEEQGIDRHTADHTLFYTLEEASEELGLSVAELENLIKDDEFSAVTIDGEYYVSTDYMWHYLKQMEEKE